MPACLAVLLALSTPAGPPGLTEADVLAAADRAHPAILAARAEIEGARGDWLASQGAFDLGLRASASTDALGYYQASRLDALVEQPTTLGPTWYAGHRLGRGEFAPYDLKLSTAQLGEARAGVRAPLARNAAIDRRRADMARAELAVALAEARLVQQRLEIGRAAALRYWDWAAAWQRLGLARALLDTARRRQGQLEQSARLGEVPALEAVENARAVQQRQGQVVAAERALQQQAFELALFRRGADGRPRGPGPREVPAPWPTNAKVPAAELPAFGLERLVGQRPEVRRLVAQRAQTTIEEAWAGNQTLPGLDLQAEIAQDLGPGPASLLPPTLVLGANFELPWPQRTARGRQAAAAASREALDAQLTLAKERAAVEVADARSAVTAAATQVGLARQELGLAQRLVGMERERFALGATSLLFVNMREQAAYEAAVREVDARAAYQRGKVSLRAAHLELLPSP